MNQSLTKIECPTINELSGLIDGSSTADPGLFSHVDTCVECQAHLDCLTEPTHLERYSKVAREKNSSQPFLGPPIRAGDIGSFDGYGIESEIGSGGMGIVFRARDENLERTVALKILTCVASPTAAARFQRESKAASNLNHPSIVPIYSAGQSHDGRPYLVMPLIVGKSLKQVIQDNTMTFRDAAEAIAQIACGLQVAHEAGLIHRDVKPANIMIDQTVNQAKLLDFGLVRNVDDQTLTRTEMMCGTPEYMSPEQANADSSDGRCDIYSLGVSLYECLTGSVPFRGKPLDVLSQHRELEPVPPSRLNKLVPRNLETICLKAIEKEPGRRYLDAQDFADDLNRYLSGKPVLAKPASFPEKAWKWSKRNLALATSLSLLLVTLLTGTIVSTALWLRSEKSAQLAHNRNESLQTSYKTLNENQLQLWKTIKDTYQKQSLGGSDPYMQLPTAVRNTLLHEMAKTYRLLFERGQFSTDELRQMARELVEVSEFTLERLMNKRAIELTALNQEIVDRLLELQQENNVEDLILASQIYKQFALARDRVDDLQIPKRAFDESIRLAELASNLTDQNDSLVAERATIIIYDSRRGLIMLESKKDKAVAREKLTELVEEVNLEEKSDALSEDWLDLQQQVFLELSRTTSGEQTLAYRNKRHDVLQEMVISVEARGGFDYWLQRKATVNTVMQGLAYHQVGKHSEAQERWTTGLRIFEQLIRQNPTNSLYRADYFETSMMVANLDWKAGDREQAIQRYENAVNKFEVTVRLNPGDPDLSRRAAQIRQLLGGRYLELGRHEEAAESFQQGAQFIYSSSGYVGQARELYENDTQMLVRLLGQAAGAYDAAGNEEQAELARQQLAKAKE